MNENVRKIFNMLGVEPNERFKIEGFNDIYYINEDLILINPIINTTFPNTFRELLKGTYEIIKLSKKKKLRDLTPEELDKWLDKNCNICNKCVFKSVTCNKSTNSYSWINNKDLYSDKFLNQEIEIEE